MRTLVIFQEYDGTESHRTLYLNDLLGEQENFDGHIVTLKEPGKPVPERKYKVALVQRAVTLEKQEAEDVGSSLGEEVNVLTVRHQPTFH